MIINSEENNWGLFVDIEHGRVDFNRDDNFVLVKPNNLAKNVSIIESMYNILSWFIGQI